MGLVGTLCHVTYRFVVSVFPLLCVCVCVLYEALMQGLKACPHL